MSGLVGYSSFVPKGALLLCIKHH